MNSGAKKKTIALLSLSLLLMMMTSTSFNAWLPIIKLGTGVVIGQHFRARCAENFANDSESSNKENSCGEREREREREKHASAHKHIRSIAHYSCFVYFFGSLCTEFRWTIDTRRVVFRRFYL